MDILQAFCVSFNIIIFIASLVVFQKYNNNQKSISMTFLITFLSLMNICILLYSYYFASSTSMLYISILTIIISMLILLPDIILINENQEYASIGIFLIVFSVLTIISICILYFFNIDNIIIKVISEKLKIE